MESRVILLTTNRAMQVIAQQRWREATMPNKLLTLVLAVLLCAAGTPVGSASRSGTDTILPLSEDEVAGLLFMREEEKLARDTYTLLFDQWGTNIFANIARSEQEHMDAVKVLLEWYGLDDPVQEGTENELPIGVFVDQYLQGLFDALIARGMESSLVAPYVGANIEEVDMRDIQDWIDLTTHGDIQSTYESLLCGSRNHLRAFVGMIEDQGVVYEAQVLSQDEVDAIVNSPIERDCGIGKGRR